jgi:CBS domain containing-hemolysin-like protein
MYWVTIILTIILLIFINAFFVAAEFAAVSSRRSRLSQFAEQGQKAACELLKVVEDPHHLDNYVASCQVGITLSSLILGFYGQAKLSPFFTPWLASILKLSDTSASAISAALILAFFTLGQVVFGELVPKNIGVQYPEKLGLMTVYPMQWSMIIFKPLIWLFNGSGRALMKLFNMHLESENGHIHAPEEIAILVEESNAGGMIAGEESRLLQNTLQLRQSTVRQIMIPRTRVMASSAELTCHEAFKVLADSVYSRMPIFEETIDNIIGVVHLKDLLYADELMGHKNIKHIMHKVPFIPGSKSILDAFNLLQKEHQHVAVVLDEYGGTAGIVTLEDLIEEIFGDLQDEFDPCDTVQIWEENDGYLFIRGETRIDEINEILDIQLPEEDAETIGGLILNLNGMIPNINDQVNISDYRMQVVKMNGRGVDTASLLTTPDILSRFKAWQAGDL